MKNGYIIYCTIMLLVSLTISCKKSDVSDKDKKFIIYNIEGNDTLGVLGTYDYPPTIAESCRNVYFSDSMLRAWNQASIQNITRENSKYMDDCLAFKLQLYQNVDNFRLEFSKKVLNNINIYLRDSDFDTGFYIIEIFYEGSAHNVTRYYLIVTRENELKSYEFEFVNSYSSFFLLNIDTVNKEKFKRFYESFKKQDNNEETMTYNGFNVTFFYRDKIESYISGCKMCVSCIEEFKNILREK